VELLASDSTDNVMMDAPARAPRRRMFKAGTIEFGGGGIDCTVRNISETGAALEAHTPLFIPDRFTLFVPTEQLKRRCRVVWRKEKRIGVMFD
jgi:PilZ domain